MEIDVIQQLISSLGFPIFVAVYMLTKSSKEIKCLTKAVNQLELAINKLAEKSD